MSAGEPSPKFQVQPVTALPAAVLAAEEKATLPLTHTSVSGDIAATGCANMAEYGLETVCVQPLLLTAVSVTVYGPVPGNTCVGLAGITAGAVKSPVPSPKFHV